MLLHSASLRGERKKEKIENATVHKVVEGKEVSVRLRTLLFLSGCRNPVMLFVFDQWWMLQMSAGTQDVIKIEMFYVIVLLPNATDNSSLMLG